MDFVEFFSWRNGGNVAVRSAAVNFSQFVLTTEYANSGKKDTKKASHFLIKNGNKARHNKKAETPTIFLVLALS